MKIKVISSLILCISLIGGSASQSSGKPKVKPVMVDTAGAAAAIKSFYAAYAANFLAEEDSANNLLHDSLVNSMLTNALQAKLKRMISAVEANPVIRAQDFDEEAAKTLQVRHLLSQWYMVSYQTNFENKDTLTQIPVHVARQNEHIVIDYITPEWEGTRYGDSLLFSAPPTLPAINASSPFSLLKTFYNAYLTAYCIMANDLPAQLAALRSRWCTPNAIAQHTAEAQKHLADGEVGYDLLIDFFDFDRALLPGVSYMQMDENTCQMCYTIWETECCILLTFAKQANNQYRIDSIAPVR